MTQLASRTDADALPNARAGGNFAASLLLGDRQRDRLPRCQHARHGLSPAPRRPAAGRDGAQPRRSFRRSARLPGRWRASSSASRRRSDCNRCSRTSEASTSSSRATTRRSFQRSLVPHSLAGRARDRGRVRHSHRARTHAPGVAAARRRDGGAAAVCLRRLDAAARSRPTNGTSLHRWPSPITVRSSRWSEPLRRATVRTPRCVSSSPMPVISCARR